MRTLFRLIKTSAGLLFVSLGTSCGGGSGVASVAPGVAIVAPPTAPPPIDCVGTPIPAPAAVLYAPAVPQPAASGDIVGVIIQNTEASTSVKRFVTFGQVFVSGRVQASDVLTATINGATTAVQMDALANWPDGSVKLASLALQLPSLCAVSQVPVMLAKSAISYGEAPPVSLADAKPNLLVRVDFTSGSYAGSQTIDLGAALQATLAVSPDYWLRGPILTQARVDVPIADGKAGSTSTFHLTADVSVFADGSAVADVQFNNDLTTILPQTGSENPQPPLPAIAYRATINFQGNQTSQTVSQVQYTSWHKTLWSSVEPQLFNVQHDIAQLAMAGAILPYDFGTGVNNSLLATYDKNILKASDYGQPLARNGVTTYMPTTGGRADIGYTTQYNTVWLLTQDARAAAVAIAQSDTSGAVPWNYRLSSGKWLTPAVSATVWIDGRGGPHGYSDGIANIADATIWTPDSAHQPNLNYVPYLMTGARWNHDRLNSQASFNLVVSWPGYRCKTPKCNILLNGLDQVRGQAWGFRELRQAAFLGRPGSNEISVYGQAVIDNWNYVSTQQPLLAASEGEPTGWYPGAYGNSGATSAWQQDYLTGIAVMAAQMGDTSAREFIAWQQPWLSGRFVGVGMNPHDGCSYNLIVSNPNTGINLRTWDAIETATVAAGLSNGAGWTQSDGDYCALARSALASALALTPSEPSLLRALKWLVSAGAPYTDQSAFRNDPTFNVFYH